MTRTLTEAEVQADFSQVLTAACNGDEFLITRGNSPVARLLPFPKLQSAAQENPYWVIDDEEWEENMAELKALRKRVWIGSPPSIEEILAARDEGRR